MLKEKNIINNKIFKYNELDYKSSPVKFSDFSSDKYNDVHTQLYNHAIDKLVSKICNENNISKETFLSKHVLIEIKQKEYWEPSKVIIKEVVYPYTINKYDLSEYWDKYIYNDDYRDLSLLMIDDDTLTDAEVVYIDYVKGKAKFRSKFTGVEFWRDFKCIDKNTRFNKDETSLEDTFTYKLTNKIYGK